MKVRIERISVLSTSLVLATVYLVIGIVFGLLGVLGGGLLSGWGNELASFGLGSIGIIIGLPILYAVAGFIVTAAFCFLYNIAAGLVGGIELTLSQEN